MLRLIDFDYRESRKKETVRVPTNEYSRKENHNLDATSIILIYQGVTRDIVRGKGTVSLISPAFVIHRIKRSMPSPKPP